MSAEGNELWSVRLRNGDVSRGTLDQLDEAFNAGHIDENSLVLAPGATQWTKLGDLAGLDDAAPPAASAPATVPPSASSFASPQTLRPMMTDLSELAFEPPRARSRFGWVVAGALVAAVGAVTLAVKSNGMSPSPNVNAAAAVAAPTVTATVAATPTATPAAPTPQPSAGTAPTTRLTDAQRKALADKDDQLAQRIKGKKPKEPASRPSRGKADHDPTQAPASGKGKACKCRAGDPLCACM